MITQRLLATYQVIGEQGGWSRKQPFPTAGAAGAFEAGACISSESATKIATH